MATTWSNTGRCVCYCDVLDSDVHVALGQSKSISYHICDGYGYITHSRYLSWHRLFEWMTRLLNAAFLQARDLVWVRTKGDKWMSGKVSGRVRVGPTRNVGVTSLASDLLILGAYSSDSRSRASGIMLISGPSSTCGNTSLLWTGRSSLTHTRFGNYFVTKAGLHQTQKWAMIHIPSTRNECSCATYT